MDRRVTTTAILLVMDSVGIGAAPDAAEYGDAGANTLAHLATAVGGIHLPALESMGLGNIPTVIPDGSMICGVSPVESPLASYGAMQEVSVGKDTTTGHWEMAGVKLTDGLHVFPPGPPSFPVELVSAFEDRTRRALIGNKAASGTEIIAELGEEQMREGAWIAYTSTDSVLQIAAHEDIIPLEELYQACEIARELCTRYGVGRVIARPYIGEPGNFTRTGNRRDFSLPPPEDTVLDKLIANDIPVTAVGKIDDVFAGRGFTRSCHSESNEHAQSDLLKLMDDHTPGLIFVNLLDFDMLYGHRRDPHGYADALVDTDAFLAQALPLLRNNDVLIITADHGNDPTFTGTDHTREYVPLLVRRPGINGKSLGVRYGFFDVAQSLASFFGIAPMPRGNSFL
jgi:phosphopentomutase